MSKVIKMGGKNPDGKAQGIAVTNSGEIKVSNTDLANKLNDVSLKLEALTGILETVKDLLQNKEQDYVGQSTDAKPEGKTGDTFLELDTKKVFVNYNNKWVEL